MRFLQWFNKDKVVVVKLTRDEAKILIECLLRLGAFDERFVSEYRQTISNVYRKIEGSLEGINK